MRKLIVVALTGIFFLSSPVVTYALTFGDLQSRIANFSFSQSIRLLQQQFTKKVDTPAQIVTQAQRKALMDKRHGYGAGTVGGYAGKEYVVTSTADSGTGTLRDALGKTEPLWIVFDRDMTINLSTDIRVKSNKTIDGRGHNITINRYGLILYGSTSKPLENVIITNVTIKDGASNSVDAISIARANKIWIDHVTLSKFKDGLIDITRALSTGMRVTVSNSKFMNHDKTTIVGLHKPTAPYDNKIVVTYDNNYFTSSTTQRHPRVSQAAVHMYNNVIKWKNYGVASYDNARVFSERNWYVAGSNKQATDYTHGGYYGSYKIPNGKIKSYGDSKRNGAKVATYLPNKTSKPYYSYKALTANTTNMNRVMSGAGARKGKIPPDPQLNKLSVRSGRSDGDYIQGDQIVVDWQFSDAAASLDNVGMYLVLKDEKGNAVKSQKVVNLKVYNAKINTSSGCNGFFSDGIDGDCRGLRQKIGKGQTKFYIEAGLYTPPNACFGHCPPNAARAKIISKPEHKSNSFRIIGNKQSASCTLDGVTVEDGKSKTFYKASHVSSTKKCSDYATKRVCDDGKFSGNIAYKYKSCEVDEPTQRVSQLKRNALVNRRHGYARYVTGGQYGAEYVVTSTANSGPGTLRDALGKTEPLWIVFDRDMTINLSTDIRVKSNKTIDGRGRSITLLNKGLLIQGGRDGLSAKTTNVIVENITIKDGDSTSVDGIGITWADNIWIDHVTVSNFKDGLIDIKGARRVNEKVSYYGRVTISNTRFDNHNKVMLVGLHQTDAIPEDNYLRVTLDNNYFTKNTTQRHPRVARATVHMYNNVIYWKSYGMSSFDNARVYSERNWYVSTNKNKVGITYKHGGKHLVGPNKGKVIANGHVKSVRDAKLGGATIATSGEKFVTRPTYSYSVVPASTSNRAKIMRNAGASKSNTAERNK